MLLNNDRLSHWYAMGLLTWSLGFVVLGIPIFHQCLGFSIAKIAVSAGIFCGSQLIITPWLYSARSTSQNPDGLPRVRTAAVLAWLSLTVLVFFYYIQRGWPSNQAAHQARIIMSVSMVAFLLVLGVLLAGGPAFRSKQ
jgi:hypothetical protein